MTHTIVSAAQMLATLRNGDTVTLTLDGRDIDVSVQHERRRMDGNGFGSIDYASVTVGYGPGRWNMEVNGGRPSVYPVLLQ